MKFRRLSYPGKTLVVNTLDRRFDPFTAYFLKFWQQKFGGSTDMCRDPGGEYQQAGFCASFATIVTLPRGFTRQWWFFLTHRYETVLFLNPDHKTERSVKWAAKCAFIKNRAGFSPLRGFLPLNFSLPFNAENHHFVHQLKLFFEHLSGEKIAHWTKPEIFSPSVTSLRENGVNAENGIVALDAADPSLPHLLPQLIKFINLVTRHETCTVFFRSADSRMRDAASAGDLARQVSAALTERAIEKVMPMIDPTPEILASTVQGASWVTGVDSETLNLAAHFEIPTLAIFGPLNERVWQPFATRARVLTGEFSCRPCTPFPGAVKCTAAIPWQCVSGVSSELMLATLNAMRRRKSPPRPSA